MLIKFFKRIFNPLLFPLRAKIYRPRHMFRTIPRIIARKAQRFFKRLIYPKKLTLKDYFPLGRFYIAKKLIYIAGILLIAGTIYFILNPPSFFASAEDEPMEIHLDPDTEIEHTGKVIVYDSAGNRLYEGDMVDGLYEGNGKLYADNDQVIYEGQFEQGAKNGSGKSYNDEGHLIYSGEYENDAMHGLGQLFDQMGNRLIYRGEFESGNYSGQGTLYHENEEVNYEGQFRKGQFNGSGTEYFSDGTMKYEGEYSENKFSGIGKLYDSNGYLIYEGTFLNNEFADSGTTFQPSGHKIYEGMFRVGAYNGEGILYFENGGVLYEGDFLHGKFHGDGIQYDPEGNLIYEGRFKDDRYSGIGTLYDQDQLQLYKGFFIDGRIAIHRFLGLSEGQIVEILEDASDTRGIEPFESESENDRQTNTQDSAHFTLDDTGQEANSSNDEPSEEKELIDYQTYLMLYQNHQMSFIIERSKDHPDITSVIQINVWDTRLLTATQTEIDEHLSKGSMSGFALENDQNEPYFYVTDNMQYKYYFNEQGTVNYLEVTPF